MTGTLKNQLDEYGMPERFPEVVDEIVRVREELGQPIMATPFSQFVGIQAVLNVVLDERYKVVPDEVLHYALGHYGPLMRPVEPEIADRIFSQPRVKDLEEWERDQTTLEEFRKQLGPNLSDEELLLRYFCPEEHVDKMLASGPLRTEPPASLAGPRRPADGADRPAPSRPISHLSLSQPGITIDLRRWEPRGHRRGHLRRLHDHRLLVGLQVHVAHPAEGLDVGVLDPLVEAEQALDHGGAAERHVGGGVAALVDRDELAVADTGGEVDHDVGQPPVALAGHHHHRQRVHHAGVEPRGDDQDLRLKGLDGGHDDPFQRRLVGAVAGAGGKRDVDGEALAVAGAGVARPDPIRPGRGRPGAGRSSAPWGLRRRRARCRCRDARPSRRSPPAPDQARSAHGAWQRRCWRRRRSRGLRRAPRDGQAGG